MLKGKKGVTVASYPGPEIGPGINRLAHAPILRRNIDGNGLMTYKLGREYRLYVIRALSLSAVYICKISVNWQSLPS